MPGKAITTERTNATAGRSLARHFRRRTTDDRQRYGAGGFRAPLAGRADEHGGLTQGVRCGQAERPRPRQRTYPSNNGLPDMSNDPQPIIEDDMPLCNMDCRQFMGVEPRGILTECRIAGPFDHNFCEPAIRRMAASHKALLATLRDIAEMTDSDNPDSYRSDDREGCLDTVHAKTTAAIAAAEQTPSAEADSPA